MGGILTWPKDSEKAKLKSDNDSMLRVIPGVLRYPLGHARFASERDVPDLIALWNACLPPDPITESFFQERFFDHVHSNPEGYFVYEKHRRLIGFGAISLHPTNPSANIEILLVDPRHRRKGLGSLLLKHLVAHVTNRGCREITAGFSCLALFEGIDADAMPEGASFLGRRGFVETGVRYEDVVGKEPYEQSLNHKARGSLTLPDGFAVRNTREAVDDVISLIHKVPLEQYKTYAERLLRMSGENPSRVDMFGLYHGNALIGWQEMNAMRGSGPWSFGLERYKRLSKKPSYGSNLFIRPEYAKHRLSRKLMSFTLRSSYAKGFTLVCAMTSHPALHLPLGFKIARKFTQYTRKDI